ncbi:CheA signal transduction histidine kinase [Natrinema thermotolerans DSM 11552]|nr:CheA signal transduction histidine kinase [Natrinema thermotolerans DSM 11552]
MNGLSELVAATNGFENLASQRHGIASLVAATNGFENLTAGTQGVANLVTATNRLEDMTGRTHGIADLIVATNDFENLTSRTNGVAELVTATNRLENLTTESHGIASLLAATNTLEDLTGRTHGIAELVAATNGFEDLVAGTHGIANLVAATNGLDDLIIATEVCNDTFSGQHDENDDERVMFETAQHLSAEILEDADSHEDELLYDSANPSSFIFENTIDPYGPFRDDIHRTKSLAVRVVTAAAFDNGRLANSMSEEEKKALRVGIAMTAGSSIAAPLIPVFGTAKALTFAVALAAFLSKQLEDFYNIKRRQRLPEEDQ